MVKALTLVGNSKAVILPAQMVKKLGVNKVTIEEIEDGIIIRPLKMKTSFQKKMDLLRKNRVSIYKQMEKEANDPRTVAYYNINTVEDVDLDIIEE